MDSSDNEALVVETYLCHGKDIIYLQDKNKLPKDKKDAADVQPVSLMALENILIYWTLLMN